MQLPSSPKAEAYTKLDKLRAEAPASVWMPVWAAAGKRDLWFLFSRILSTQSIQPVKECHPWLFERAREVQASPNGHLDVWFREGCKTSLITHALTTFDLINDPELTFGIFSHTKHMARGVLRNIKTEYETNDLLKSLYPHIFWSDPRKEALKWSEDDGIVLKRNTNKREASIEAWGLVDGQPTGKHFQVLVYDDVVSDVSVSTEDQKRKTTDAWRLSLNLGSYGCKKRFIGTRYDVFDTWAEILECGAAKERRYPCFDAEGQSVLYPMEYIEEKRRAMGPSIFAAQMLCNPTADIVDGFKAEWLRYYKNAPWDERLDKTIYLLVDPAHSRKERDTKSDYTVFAVLGLGPDANYYLLDLVRDRLNLTDRTDKLFDLVRTWRPNLVGYERYGAQSDIQHMDEEMERRRHRFEIHELKGRVKKEDRIRRLIPVMERGRFYIPEDLIYRDVQGEKRDLIKEFIQEELVHFPLSKHDDMLDCVSRILDPDFPALFPNAADLLLQAQKKSEDAYDRAWREMNERRVSQRSWQSA